MCLWRNRGFGRLTAKSIGGSEGLVLEVEPGALASVNGVPTPGALLRNGDMITLGGVTLRFSLSPIQQSSAALREWLTWIALGAFVPRPGGGNLLAESLINGENDGRP
jgi:hypothetical protein